MALFWVGALSVLLMNSGVAQGLTASKKMEPRVTTFSDTSGEMILLVVDKSELRAEIKTWPEHFEKSESLMSFKIAIGKEEGDKQIEGDNKTPEGIYFALVVKDGRDLPEKYGPKAIPINFPNPYDSILKKTGHGIWLHGVEADQRIEAAKVTEGCVAFYNGDILTLTKWLQPHQSIVIIADKAEQVNQADELARVKQLTEQWQQAWATRNLDEYISFYDESFRFKSMHLKSYKDYKNRVFSRYKQMKLALGNIRVFTHKDYAMTIMNQDFAGDNIYKSKGRKILYWKKYNDNNWKIIHERFENRRLNFSRSSRDDVWQTLKKSQSVEGKLSKGNTVETY